MVDTVKGLLRTTDILEVDFGVLCSYVKLVTLTRCRIFTLLG